MYALRVFFVDSLNQIRHPQVVQLQKQCTLKLIPLINNKVTYLSPITVKISAFKKLEFSKP